MSESGKVTRREVLSKMGKLAAGAAVAPLVGKMGSAAPEERSRKPNILFIVVDDLGYGDVGCYGSTICDTPNLDTLAEQGARLSHYYVATPLCAPTRVSVMTGKYPQRTSLSRNPKWYDFSTGLTTDETTIAEVLRDAGYHTGLVGKWHLGYGPKLRPRKQGFQEYWGFLSGWVDYYDHTYREGRKWMFRNDEPHDEPGYMTDLITREAMSYIDRHKGEDEPFFLYVAYNAPHWPEQAPEEWMKKSRHGVYGAMVGCMDDGIGRLIRHLDESGLADDTLVVWMSDNGGDGHGTNAPLSGGKGNIKEGGIRVPAMARWPGRIPAGSVVAEPVISMDLFTTFASVAGAQLPKRLVVDGKDILPVLEGEAKSPHRVIFWDYRGVVAARMGNLKLYKEQDKAPCVHDVVNDPGEETDLAPQFPKFVEKMSAELERWRSGLKNRS